METHVKRLLVCLTERQHGTLGEAAKACGRSMADFIREVVFEFIGKGGTLKSQYEPQKPALIPEKAGAKVE